MVEYYIGKRSKFAYGKEATYSVAPAASAWGYVPIQTVTPSSKSSMTAINILDATVTRNVSDYYENLRTFSASVEGVIQHFAFPSYAWGTDSYSTGTHSIQESDDIPSFSMNFGHMSGTDPHIIELLGGKINTMKISCEKNDFVKFNAEIIAKTETENPSWRTHYAGSDVTKPYTITELEPYHYSGTTVTIDGDEYCDVESVSINLNNNLYAEPVLCATNGKRIAEPIPQLREYDAEVTLKMRTTALYDLWQAGEILAGETSISFAMNSRVLKFTLTDAMIESAISPLKITEGLVLVTIPLKTTQILVTEENSISQSY